MRPAVPDDPWLCDMMALLLAPGLGPVRVSALLAACGGDPGAVLGTGPAGLQRVQGIGKVTADRAAAGFAEARRRAVEEVRALAEVGAGAVAIGDEDYPPLLAELHDAPPVLFVRGDLGAALEPCVAMVGSRRCTHYGMEQAERMGAMLASAGVCVVSGGARGVDAASHRGCLRAGGRTVVVLGSGLCEPYPPEHGELFDAIVADGRGAVVSELPPRTGPLADNFPARNRIISGLSLGVVVVEADERSGSLITARVACDEHNREVMAIPGPVDSRTSRGCHRLIQQGAALVTDAQDVLACLETRIRQVGAMRRGRAGGGGSEAVRAAGGAGDAAGVERRVGGEGDVGAGAGVGAGVGVGSVGSDGQERLLEALRKPLTPDELCEATGLPAERVRADLTWLELQGRVRRDGVRLHRVEGRIGG